MKSIHQVFFGLLRLAVSGTPYEVSPMTDEDWAVLSVTSGRFLRLFGSKNGSHRGFRFFVWLESVSL